jgi:hypothetical protein
MVKGEDKGRGFVVPFRKTERVFWFYKEIFQKEITNH